MRRTTDMVVHISREHLNAVVRSIIWLRDNFHVFEDIDLSHLMVEFDEIQNAILFLQKSNIEENDSKIIMSEDQFHLFLHIIGYTCNVLNYDRIEDVKILEKIYADYINVE